MRNLQLSQQFIEEYSQKIKEGANSHSTRIQKDAYSSAVYRKEGAGG